MASRRADLCASMHTGDHLRLDPSGASSSNAGAGYMRGAAEHMHSSVFDGVLAFCSRHGKRLHILVTDCLPLEWSCTGRPPLSMHAAPLPAQARDLSQPVATVPRQVRPRLEPRAASEHAECATNYGRREQRADAPELAWELGSNAASSSDSSNSAEEATDELQDLEPDDASSRNSAEWGEEADEGADRGDAHFDDLGAIGFALAESAALLPEFRTHMHSRDCIVGAWMKPMTGTCTQEDTDNLNSCMDVFFTRRPVLQSTSPRRDREQAFVLKTVPEIQRAWRSIFERRRLAEPDDMREIQDPLRLAGMWTAWMNEWLENELTDAQSRRRRTQKIKLFAAWVHQNMGGKPFVMSVWQTGISWAPPPELLDTDYKGALEHVAINFASWTRRLARAVTRHKRDPATVEARIRSGQAFRSHGLTPQQVQERAERATARRIYYKTVDLHNKLKAGKGEGKGKGQPKYWGQMSYNEKWWLEELWEGRLRKAMDEAEGKCHRVQALRFSVHDQAD